VGARNGAPTRLKLSGAIAGFVAGGLGAAAYALSCKIDTIPFIAIWWLGDSALCSHWSTIRASASSMVIFAQVIGTPMR
jgi:hypothetical protein